MVATTTAAALRARFEVKVVALIAALFLAPAASAHHSVAAEFDTSQRAELEGEITQVWFTNPHVRYRLTVTNADGAREDWELQGGNVTNLLRQNWTADSLRVGDRVTASGALGRNGAKKLQIREIVTADGRVVPAARRSARDAARYDRCERRQGLRLRRTPSRPDRYHGPVAQRLQVASHGRRSRAEAATFHARRPAPLRVDASVARPFDALPRAWAAANFRRAVQHGHRRRRQSLPRGLPRAQHAATHLDGRAHAAGQHTCDADGLLRRPLGRRRARDRDDASSAGWLDGSGLPMAGDGTRIVERYEFADDRLSIARTMTIYDPYLHGASRAPAVLGARRQPRSNRASAMRSG